MVIFEMIFLFVKKTFLETANCRWELSQANTVDGKASRAIELPFPTTFDTVDCLGKSVVFLLQL